MRYLLRAVIVAVLPTLISLLINKLTARTSPASKNPTRGRRLRPRDTLVLEPQQEDSLLPSEVSTSNRRAF